MLFRSEDESGKYLNENGELGDDPTKMAVTAATPLQIDGVPLGTYTVTELETGREIDAYAFVADDSTTEGAAELTANTDEENPAIVELVNAYKTTGAKAQLQVTKKVEGDGYAGKDEFTFQLTRYEDQATNEESDDEESEDEKIGRAHV